jgi:hypothetical protein
MHHSTFVWIAASVVAVLSIARTARFICWDDFPPMEALRLRLVTGFGENWGKVWTCQFCLAPYLTAGMGVWVWLSDLNAWWWIINGWWAASYLAAIVVAYDQPED